jgi:hypothetical protein
VQWGHAAIVADLSGFRRTAGGTSTMAESGLGERVLRCLADGLVDSDTENTSACGGHVLTFGRD